MKRIAIDAKRLFLNNQGLGSYARTLIHDLCVFYPQYEYYLYTPKYLPGRLDAKTEAQVKIITKPKYLSEWYWRQWGIGTSLAKLKIDVCFGLSNEIPRGLKSKGIGTAVMIHDVLYKVYPQQFSKADRWIYQQKFKHAINRSDRIIAASKSTKNDLLAHFSIEENKIQVIYQSVNPTFRQEKSPSSKREHFLVVGSINQRKNLSALIHAYHLLPEGFRKKVLVVGQGKAYKKEMKTLLAKKELLEYFEFLGQVSDKRLFDLYHTAIALVFPSEYEGFGIPLIEAMHTKTAVIANKTSSIPEVLKNYGTIVECNVSEALKEALIKVQRQIMDKQSLDENLLKSFDPVVISSNIITQLKMTSTLP